ncbi:copper resistance CopC family protein [Nonomuraea maritima]|uniref:copper resistance CopC family protein n=1 Tax=Nonomuraea maritima TaxID=683260 RepID=UPI0037225EF8
MVRTAHLVKGFTVACRSSITRLLVLVAIVFAAVAGVVAPASAHAMLKSSNPENGSTVTEPLSSIRLVFSEDVPSMGTTVAVVGSDGVPVTDGNPQVTGATVTQRLKPGLAGGEYTIAYRVVSDGHPMAAELHFTLRTPEAAAPAASLPSAGAAAAAASVGGPDTGVPGVLLVVGAAVIALGGVILVAGRKRPATPRRDADPAA